MNLRTLLFVAVMMVGVVAIYALRTSAPDANGPAPTADAVVVVTFFTVPEPCETTQAIEKLSRQAVTEGFPDEVAAGEVVFRVVDSMLPEHEHYLDTYEIGNRALVVTRRANGEDVEWTPCHDVWLLFEEPEQFFACVREPIRGYLGKS